jgi:hypothetical protein
MTTIFSLKNSPRKVAGVTNKISLVPRSQTLERNVCSRFPPKKRGNWSSGKFIWNMGTSDLCSFRFLKISKLHTFISLKIMALNIQKDIYGRSIREKVPLKILYILGYTKKTKFWQKIYYFTTTSLLFTIRNLSFLYLSKYNVFLTGLFSHTLLLYISIYIFNTIIFGDIKVWDFKKIQNSKSEGSTGAHVHQIPSPGVVHNNYIYMMLSIPHIVGLISGQIQLGKLVCLIFPAMQNFLSAWRCFY